jgi:predicted enzyme related to lactoylglutathione lyase
MRNALNWVEIPAAHFERATAFYANILGAPLRTEVLGGIPNAILPYEGEEAMGGSIVANPRLKPGADGPVVYLNATGIIDAVLSRIPAAGGKLLTPKIETEFGALAWFIDSEGNRVGLHSA